MLVDPVFQAIVFGTLIALGVGIEKARVTLRIRRRRKARRDLLGCNVRREPEPVWAKWDASIGQGLRR